MSVGLIKKAEPISLSILGSLAGKALTAALAKRVGVTGSNYFLRKNPLKLPQLKNHFAGMSRMGLEAGLNPKKQISPLLIKMLGIAAPTHTGALDYEFSKVIGTRVINELKEKGIAPTSENIQKALSGWKGRSNIPESQDSSSILKNLSNGINQEKTPGYLRGLSKATPTDNQISTGVKSYFGGVGLQTALENLDLPIQMMRGTTPIEFASNLLSDKLISSYEQPINMAYALGGLNTVGNIKSKIMKLVQHPFLQRMQKVVSPLAHIANPTLGEFTDLAHSLNSKNNMTDISSLGGNAFKTMANKEIKEKASVPILKDLYSDMKPIISGGVS